MEYFKNELCVTYEELTSGDDPVIKFYTLNKNITRGNIKTLQRGGGEGSYALIVYSSLKEKYKVRYVAKYGNPEEVLKLQRMRDKVKTDEKAREFFETFEYDMNGVQTGLSEKLKAEYTLNASVLNALVIDLEVKTRSRNMRGNSLSTVWENVAATSENLRKIYGHTLPENLSRLREKINRYKKESYVSLISGKVGNASTVKITEEAGRFLIALKRSRVPVYTDIRIFEEYNRVAPDKGWKPLKSKRSLTMWFARPEIEPLWYDAVHGELAAHQRYGRKHRTELPLRRDTLWYGDGTKLNLYYRDEDGNMRTTMVYEVMDAYSEVLLGYHISDHENFEAQYNAYRMAVQTSGHKPYEIVHDNQGGHKRLEKEKGTQEPGFFDLICHVHRPTAPYSGQSKTIESVFGRFQSQELNKDWRFTGMNITAKKDSSRPNLEFVEANKDKLFTLEELEAHYIEARKAWNEAKHPATGIPRIEMYEKSVNEETDVVTVYDMVDIFWIWTKRPATFTDSGIEITIGGKKLAYEVYERPGVPDHKWRMKNTYRTFHVKYDPNDLRSIRLYWEDKAKERRFERIAEPYMVIHRAIQDQTDGEAAFIRQEQEANIRDRIDRQVIAKEIEYAYGVAPEQNGLSTPKVKGVTKEVQQEIDRRTRTYSRKPEEYRIGRVTKKASLMTWDQLTENKTMDTRKVAGKL
ncbi:kinase [uncultured Parabacteroides sp.]|uniref:kinase n=1 Tax=uncultured Parabacteroides sp. TaxID=512312 RepID=UPI00260491B4|nr:kinase [uncultured Parabacteroides sp.]